MTIIKTLKTKHYYYKYDFISLGLLLTVLFCHILCVRYNEINRFIGTIHGRMPPRTIKIFMRHWKKSENSTVLKRYVKYLFFTTEKKPYLDLIVMLFFYGVILSNYISGSKEETKYYLNAYIYFKKLKRIGPNIKQIYKASRKFWGKQEIDIALEYVSELKEKPRSWTKLAKLVSQNANRVPDITSIVVFHRPIINSHSDREIKIWDYEIRTNIVKYPIIHKVTMNLSTDPNDPLTNSLKHHIKNVKSLLPLKCETKMDVRSHIALASVVQFHNRIHSYDVSGFLTQNFTYSMVQALPEFLRDVRPHSYLEFCQLLFPDYETALADIVDSFPKDDNYNQPRQDFLNALRFSPVSEYITLYYSQNVKFSINNIDDVKVVVSQVFYNSIENYMLFFIFLNNGLKLYPHSRPAKYEYGCRSEFYRCFVSPVDFKESMYPTYYYSNAHKYNYYLVNVVYSTFVVYDACVDEAKKIINHVVFFKAFIHCIQDFISCYNISEYMLVNVFPKYLYEKDREKYLYILKKYILIHKKKKNSTTNTNDEIST